MIFLVYSVIIVGADFDAWVSKNFGVGVDFY
jgi:hypothetical protein